MKGIIGYFYTTLMVIQIIFALLWFTDINLFWIISWIGHGKDVHLTRLFLPLIIYGTIKILYWFADPLSELFNIILKWVVIIAGFYLFYWLFFT